jgi:hypothetical protein
MADDERRSETLRVRLTPGEREQLGTRAEEASESVSDYVRRRALED